MTDNQIEKLIEGLIKEKGITLWDMIGGKYIDPKKRLNEPYGNPERCRWNRFKAESWSERFIELISDGEYNQHSDYYSIKIPVQDIIRFWWNQCIDRECMLDVIFEDIFSYFKDKMILKPEVPEVDLSIDAKQLRLDDVFQNVVNQ